MTPPSLALASLASPPQRTIGTLITAGGLLLTVANLPAAIAQTPHFSPAWSAGAIACIALIAGLSVGSRRLPARALHVLWITVPTLGALLLATWAGAYHGADLNTVDPWLRGLLPAFICYPILFVGRVASVVLAVGLCLLPGASTVVFLGEPTSLFASNTVVHLGNLMFLAIMIGLSQRLHDVYARESEVREARRREVWAHTHTERQRAVARLVHDDVLASLSAAVAVEGDPPPVLRDAAAAALAVMSATPAPLDADDVIPLADGARAIHESLSELPADLELRIEPTAATIPATAASALGLAAAEAVRNAVRHARTRPWVTIAVADDPSALRIDIEDDGPGFDQTALPADRLGVRESIVGRVEDAGGRCEIDSSPARGSRVSLRWPR